MYLNSFPELFYLSASLDSRRQILYTTKRSQLLAKTSSSPSCNTCMSATTEKINNIIIYWRVFHPNVESRLLHYKIGLENLHIQLFHRSDVKPKSIVTGSHVSCTLCIHFKVLIGSFDSLYLL